MKFIKILKLGVLALLALFLSTMSGFCTDSYAVSSAGALRDDAVTIFGYVTVFLLTVMGFYIMWSIVKGLRRK